VNTTAGLGCWRLPISFNFDLVSHKSGSYICFSVSPLGIRINTLLSNNTMIKRLTPFTAKTILAFAVSGKKQEK
jgi:hypothetical protein